MASRSLNRNASLVRDVRAALNHISDGTYGFCVECDVPIPQKRLAAVPWAARCVSCQESVETAGVSVEELAA